MNYDIIIIGSGIVGQTLACMLAEKTTLSIALMEANSNIYSWNASTYHHRVSAISLSSKRIFTRLNLWNNITTKRASPFKQIKVWDAITDSKIHFDSREIAESVLGYIVENNLLQTVLHEKLEHYPLIKKISPIKLLACHFNQENIEFRTIDHKYSAKLAIAADGAHSWLRLQANIPVEQLDYGQQAIVTTVKTSLPHEQVAQQIFLDAGPLAFLPLSNPFLSSIVWSLPIEKAEIMMNLTDEQFKYELKQSFLNKLGDILEIDKRYAFPLYKQQAKYYVKPRIALVGDAAHTVHPLAGQGLNMGLLDAACLAEVITDAVLNGRDCADDVVLRRYQRWRKADNLSMIMGIDWIKNIFASNHRSLQTLRSFGLTAIDQIQWLKHVFMKPAVGNRQDLPKIASPH